MSDQPTAPPVMEAPTPPPVLPPQDAPQPPKPQKPWQKAWAGFLALIAAAWKYIYLIFKFGKVAKILLTAGTMLLSVWAYAHIFGWQIAIGFVILIFIHEMGHVFMAWRLGMPISSPIFIPFVGALIIGKRFGGSAWRNAIMGIGGPLFGAFGSTACYVIYSATGNLMYLALAFLGFFMNLFNMIPMFPLDGGWITGAVSHYIWVAGLAVLLGLTVMGYMHNPFVYLLIILSLPRIIDAFRRGTADPPGQRTTPTQKVVMGLCYILLSAFLAGGVAVSALSAPPEQPAQQDQPAGNPAVT
jgi:Zn-dependent protease